MVDNDDYEEYKVLKGFKEDVYRGWVRINKEDRKDKNGNEKFTRKNLVLIEKKGSDSKLVRRILGVDKKPKNEKWILMDFDTRYNEGEWNLRKKQTYQFKITKIKWYNVWTWLVKYYLNHPDIAIKISTRFSIISIAIAILSLIIACNF